MSLLKGKNRTLEVNKALNVMGFGTWNNLDPESEKKGKTSVQDIASRLNKQLFIKMQEIEAKREQAVLLEKRLSKMPDGPKKRQLIYKRNQEEAHNKKYHKTPVDEERALHESYQILLQEFEFRRIKCEKAETQRHKSSSTSDE